MVSISKDATVGKDHVETTGNQEERPFIASFWTKIGGNFPLLTILWEYRLGHCLSLRGDGEQTGPGFVHFINIFPIK